jgi:hypothetical protein
MGPEMDPMSGNMVYTIDFGDGSGPIRLMGAR